MDHIRPERPPSEEIEQELTGTAEAFRGFLGTQEHRSDSLNALRNEALQRVTAFNEVTPTTYVVLTEQLLMDCYHGRHGLNDEPVPSAIHYQDPHIINVFRNYLSQWAQEAFGEAFEEQVTTAREQYYRNLEVAAYQTDDALED